MAKQKDTERATTEFPDWMYERYPSGIAALAKIDDGSAKFQIYAWRCITSAEKARAWKKAYAKRHLDPYEAARRADVEYLRSVQGAAAAARKVVVHIRRYPFKSAGALGHALLDLKDKDGAVPLITATSEPDCVNPFGYGPGTVPDIVARLLESYVAAMKQNPLAKAGPFEHRLRYGALLHEKPIDKQSARPDPIATSLLFELALFGRHFTSPQTLRLAMGSPMPDTGQPVLPVVVAFLEDTLDQFLSQHEADDRLRKLIKRNPGVSWAGWPAPPKEFLDTPDT